MKLTRLTPGLNVDGIPADTWNRFCDVAEQAGRRPRQADRFRRQTPWIRVQNKSGYDCDAMDILGIKEVDTGMLDAHPYAMFERPVFVGTLPTNSHKGKFAVCLQAIPNGAIGYAVADGLAFVRLASTTEEWRTADVDASDRTQLKLDPSGSAQVLWFDNWGTTSVLDHNSDPIVDHNGDSILDNASGGEIIVALVRLSGPTAEVSARHVAIAREDIEHNAVGEVEFANGSAFDMDAWTGNGSRDEAFNPGPRVWNGSNLIIGKVELDGADAAYCILRAWSPTRLRGTAINAILPGQIGTVNALYPIDGAFTPTSVQAFLPTTYVEVAQGMTVWMELVYRASTDSSRWEIYSSDCDVGD